MAPKIGCITNKGKRKKQLWMNGKIMTLTFFELYTVYMKQDNSFSILTG